MTFDQWWEQQMAGSRIGEHAAEKVGLCRELAKMAWEAATERWFKAAVEAADKVVSDAVRCKSEESQ